MKVTHFCTNDALGGAARASTRLHRALVQAGCDSRMYVLNKTGDDERTERVVRSSWYQEARQQFAGAALNATLFRYRAREAFSFENACTSSPTAALAERARGSQIVNLHWTRGVVTARQAQRVSQMTGASIVWTLMDLGMLTGGCHYMHGCTRYHESCGRCPLINSSSDGDVTRRTWKRRRRSFAAVPPTLIACNTWTRDRVRESSLLRHARCEIIPLAIDVDVFRPIARPLAREVLGVPRDARIVFSGALKLDQARKGTGSLVEALAKLPPKLDAARLRDQPVLIMTAGQGNIAGRLELPFAHQHLGLLGDDRSLALAYCAADVFVSPSIEDAGPMMVNESLACGTPVVAYAIGTAADQVSNGANGWLAPPGDPDALADGMARVLDSRDTEGLRAKSRATALTHYSPANVARRYLDLYADLAASRA